MQLLTTEIRKRLPKLYANEDIGLEALAQVRFFTYAGGIWYASEFDGDDLFFGLVIGIEPELGYFRLSELLSVQEDLGIPVERDLYFEPTSLRELLADHKRIA